MPADRTRTLHDHGPPHLAGKLPAMPEDQTALASRREWLRTRQLLNRHRRELMRRALELYPESLRLGRTGFLMPEHWRLDEPVVLASVGVELVPAATPFVTGRQPETLAVRPLRSAGQHYYAYHQAMQDLDKPQLFENRICYRLVGRDGGWHAQRRAHRGVPAGDARRRRS
jgi:hypothetical protein